MSHSLCQNLSLSSAFPWGPLLSAGQQIPNTPSLCFPLSSSLEPRERRWDEWMDTCLYYFLSHSSTWLTSISAGYKRLPATVRSQQPTLTVVYTADTTTELCTIVGHKETTMCCMPEKNGSGMSPKAYKLICNVSYFKAGNLNLKTKEKKNYWLIRIVNTWTPMLGQDYSFRSLIMELVFSPRSQQCMSCYLPQMHKQLKVYKHTSIPEI